MSTKQRFISGLPVFDTYNSRDGSISEMNLNLNATHPLSTMYVGPYFVVTFQDLTVQLFTINGNRVIDNAGNIIPGITLLNQAEKLALLSAGYPA